MSLARSGRRQAIDRLVQIIEEGIGSTRHNASRALETCGDAAVDPLIIALWSSDVDTRRYVIRALGKIGSQRARQALVHILSLEAEEAYYDLLRIESLKELPQKSGVQLLADALMDRVAQARLNALQVLHTVFGDRKGMRIILSNLNHPEPYVRASAIEALEVRVDPTLISGILPLFEHSSPKVVAEHGGSYFKIPSKQPMEVLSALASDRSRWIRACALFAAGQVGGAKALPLLERRLTDSYELARLNAIEAMGNLAGAASLPLLEAMSASSEGHIRDYCRIAVTKIRKRSQ
jgi:HEAT repeat protein